MVMMFSPPQIMLPPFIHGTFLIASFCEQKKNLKNHFSKTHQKKDDKKLKATHHHHHHQASFAKQKRQQGRDNLFENIYMGVEQYSMGQEGAFVTLLLG